MKFGKVAAAIILIGMSPPVSAQSVPEDARCLLLSNGFAKGAKDERAKQVAAETLIFFIGRLDGRAAPQALTNAMRSQATSIDPKTAGPEMTACAARVARAKQAIQVLGRNAAPTK